jgi:hypothetical protein
MVLARSELKPASPEVIVSLSRRRARNAIAPTVSAIETAIEIADPNAAGTAFMMGGAISGPLQSALRAGGGKDGEPTSPERAERAARRAARRSERRGR